MSMFTQVKLSTLLLLSAIFIFECLHPSSAVLTLTLVDDIPVISL